MHSELNVYVHVQVGNSWYLGLGSICKGEYFSKQMNLTVDTDMLWTPFSACIE